MHMLDSSRAHGCTGCSGQSAAVPRQSWNGFSHRVAGDLCGNHLQLWRIEPQGRPLLLLKQREVHGSTCVCRHMAQTRLQAALAEECAWIVQTNCRQSSSGALHVQYIFAGAPATGSCGSPGTRSCRLSSRSTRSLSAGVHSGRSLCRRIWQIIAGWTAYSLCDRGHTSCKLLHAGTGSHRRIKLVARQSNVQ